MTEYSLKIFRYNPEKRGKSFFQTYKIKANPGWSILDCLNEIKWHRDGTLAFRRSCRSGICGSCAMNINGRNMLACETRVSDIKRKTITIKPLPFFEIIKDLVVDFDPFFDGIKAIKPFLIQDKNTPVNQERGQTKEEREKLDGLYECIHCGSCTSSCPSFRHNDKFPGPAALLKAFRYIADSRDSGKGERYPLIDTTDGIWRCHTIFNCVEACPKNLNPTKAIQQLKRNIIKDKLSKWLSILATAG